MLKYVGIGFITGIPARDLSETDLAELERTAWHELQSRAPSLKGKRLKPFLLESGQYIEVKAAAGPSENK